MKNSPVSPVQTLPDFYVGSVIDSADLRFREAFIGLLWESLLTHHVILKAPRRTGKTSVMEHLRAHPQAGFVVLYENVQDLTHPADFFLAILDNLRDQHPRVFDHVRKGWGLLKKLLPEVELEYEDFKFKFRADHPDYAAQWRTHGDALFERLRFLGSRVLIIVDELPDMVLNLKKENPALLREFLAWFRDKRQNPPPKSDSVRWLLGGSVNLSSTLDAIGMVDLVNDLKDEPLPSLTDAQVEEFVSSMLTARQVPFEDGVPARLRERLGRPIPIFMQMLTQDLHRSWRESPRTLAPSDVDTVFDRLISSTAAQDKLQHYYTRLAKYYDPPDALQAHAILDHLCRTADGASRQALLTEYQRTLPAGKKTPPAHELKRRFLQLLHDLENDFYVTETAPDQWDFGSGILKSWWRKYYA
jgi:hypothetical protein